MVDDTDRRRARGCLERTLHSLDALEQNLESCSDSGLGTTLREIQRRKARHSTALLRWLRLGEEGSRSSFDTATETREESGDEKAAGAASLEPGGEADGTVAVIERRDLTPDLMTLKVQRPAAFDFLPGQSTKLGLAGLSRRYSIASSPDEPFLEFFIELVPGGEMSGRLRTLSPGDPLTLEAPKGSFLLDENFSTHLMVATVTGVSPFVSMLRHHFAAGAASATHRFVLLHGASYQDEFGYQNELEGLAASNPGEFTYVPTVSRPDEGRNAGWSGERGRVGSIVQPQIEQMGLSPASTCVYACGHSAMVNDIADRFGSQGFSVKREAYD